MKLIGPIAELLPMTGLPASGPVADERMAIVKEAGVVVDEGMIVRVGSFEELIKEGHPVEELPSPAVALPGLIDAHTHICFAGSRADDYAKRLQGKSYLEIAEEGGGILDTVKKTRAATKKELAASLKERALRHLRDGVTVCEVKSGYGLTIDDELKMLEAVAEVDQEVPLALIPTCLAAHLRPPEYKTNREYLHHLETELFPKILKLTRRIDIFVEKSAFTAEEAKEYLEKAKALGLSLCLHADQFTRSGAQLAAAVGALSADHLEVSEEQDFEALARAGTAAVALPGASLGLGLPFAAARKALNAGCSLVIASDWNPGSAPMGRLLTQAALLGAAEKLTAAETFAALTCRAAAALELKQNGALAPGMRADLILFAADNYREILYHQGSMNPVAVYIAGRCVSNHLHSGT